MCARKSKTKKFSHQDCTTCHQSNGSVNGGSNPNLQTADPTICAPKIILCPKVLKVADKDVEVGERPSIQRARRYDRRNSKEGVAEDSEELRRKAFELYKQYLLQKKGDAKLPPDYCPPEPVTREIRCWQEQEDTCYDPSFNIFLVIVFLILFVMLIITTGCIYVVYNNSQLTNLFKTNALYFAVPAVFVIFLMNCTMACSSCSRVLPCNFLYLLFAVACMCIILSVITVAAHTTIVLMIYAATAVVVAFFIMLAYSPFDFNKWILYVIAIILALLAIWGLHAIFKKYLNVTYGSAELFLAIICTVMNVLILVIELQLLLSGRSIDLDESEYATGAYLLYTSVLELFFNLVQATGVLEESDLKDDPRIQCA